MINGKKFVAVFITGVMVGSSALAGFAALPAGQKAIQAVLNMDKKIYYQGQFLKDSKGINMNSISYNGLEYIPITALEKTNVAVNRGEGKDNGIYIGSTGKELILNSPKFIDKTRDYYTVYTTADQELFLSGKGYKYGYGISKKFQVDDYDSFENSGGLDPIIELTTGNANFTSSEFMASFYIPEDVSVWKYDNSIKGSKGTNISSELKLIVVSISDEGETVIVSEPLTPGKILDLRIPFIGQKIGFRIGTTGAYESCVTSYLNLTVLEPKFIK